MLRPDTETPLSGVLRESFFLLTWWQGSSQCSCSRVPVPFPTTPLRHDLAASLERTDNSPGHAETVPDSVRSSAPHSSERVGDEMFPTSAHSHFSAHPPYRRNGHKMWNDRSPTDPEGLER